ncbi:MAG TPA: DsbA family protein [Rhodanobacteraceae bacterium]|jgi:2-hydroxychromene-2-carboxylate isomerase|nr:DsbA family protein [Rhodanobacteraceae bacterium]
MEAHWYFDFGSPLSYLQLAKVREWRSRMPVTAEPIALRALLKSQGSQTLEGAGISESATRLIKWRAKTAGISLEFPPGYPFNSAAALRLCIAAGSSWNAVEVIFGHLWRDGRAGSMTTDLVDVGHALGIANVEAAIKSAETGHQLRLNTEAALAIGVRNAPCVRIGSELFWGADAAERVDEWLARGHDTQAADLKLRVGWY